MKAGFAFQPEPIIDAVRNAVNQRRDGALAGVYRRGWDCRKRNMLEAWNIFCRQLCFNSSKAMLPRDPKTDMSARNSCHKLEIRQGHKPWPLTLLYSPTRLNSSSKHGVCHHQLDPRSLKTGRENLIISSVPASTITILSLASDGTDISVL